MENNEKYFVPEIEDIRVGYEYEIYSEGHSEESVEDFCGWYKYKFRCGSCWRDLDDIEQALKDKIIRVPHLTKEQIESEGWIFTSSYDTGTQCFSKRDLYIVYSESEHNIFIKRDVNTPVTYTEPFFSGECKSINEFRIIQKLLKIK